METGTGRMLFTRNVKRMIVPAFIEPTLAAIKSHHRSGGLPPGKPWVPETLPIQLMVLGDIAFAGIPGEITTVAGRRLRKSLLETLQERGITKVILCPYANAYCGYITTHEEYQFQFYEGGHTIFGEWTLGAFQTRFRALAREMKHRYEERSHGQADATSGIFR